MRFIRFTALTLTVLTLGFAHAEDETFKDRIWLWCHVEGAHDTGRRNHQDLGFGGYRFSVSPRQAADLFGIENVFMVKYNTGPNPGPKPEEFSRYYDAGEFNLFKKVIWSVVGESGRSSLKERTKALELYHSRTNIVGFVMDDFFATKHRALSPVQVSQFRQESGAKLWVVFYNDDLSKPHFDTRFIPWLKEVDGITLWFKDQASLTLDGMDADLSKLEKQLSGFRMRPKVMLGCYMWKYLERPHGNIRSDYMAYQLEFAKRSLLANRIDGVIFLASCIAEPDGAAEQGINAVKNWIALNKETRLPYRP
jgi:hypothetical protein